MLFYDDFPVGRSFALGPRPITAEEIIAFAEQFDPQPFHLDGDSAEAETTGGLIASGWHTCSILMRMMCDAYLLDTASLGSAGLESIRWRLPVRPGDTLTGQCTVTGRRRSKSNDALGLVDFAYSLDNQHGERVIDVEGMGMVRVS